METMATREGLALMIAPKRLCTDNAAMIASLAFYKYQAEQFAAMNLEPKATSD
jgi:tRNA A37 threonylcarbamoyltransferase TsaD